MKLANAIACEYIAQGSNGKHTLVNCFSGDIIVAELPAIIVMAFYIEVVPNTIGNTDVEIQVRLGKKTLAKIEAVFDFEPPKMGLVVLPPLPIKVPERSELRVILTPKGGRSITAIRKTISEGII